MRGGESPPLGGSRNATSTSVEEGKQAEFSEGHQDEEPEREGPAYARRIQDLMACFRPIKCYKKPGGGLAFSSKDGWADFPLEIACGQCMGCRVAKQRAWAIRCVHESQMHEVSSFITLTYDAEHLPSDGGLRVEHWQKFAKRMRKAVGPFRYFHCGEYGGKTKRPHYHALIFGVDFSSDRRQTAKTKQGEPIFESPTLEGLWPFGFSNIGAVNYTTASYVAGYCLKKVNGEAAEKEYRRVDLETGEVFDVTPEYVTMSRRPGIGATWFEKYKSDVFPRDEVILAGRQLPVPPFYDRRLEKMNRGMWLRVSEKRRERGKAQEKKGESSYERMDVRSEVLRRKMQEKVRQLD